MKRIQLIFLFTLGFTAISFAMGPLDKNKPVDNSNQIDLRIGVDRLQYAKNCN